MSELAEKLRRILLVNDVPGLVQALSKIEADQPDPPIDTLHELADNPAFTIRKAAISALGRIGDPSSLLLILAHVDSRGERDRHVRQAAVHALASYDDPAATRGLQIASGDPALNVRSDAKGLLSQRGNHRPQ